ncbi:LacI family transcriptional regulator [Actinomadura madurae]|nr:LacI family transcriptional regulator [Actinomadura madurae]
MGALPLLPTRSRPREWPGTPRRECRKRDHHPPPARPRPPGPAADPRARRAARRRVPATASRVLNGSARVSKAARLQVEEAVERLGYVRRRTGSPDRESSGTIAAVVCEDGCRVLGDAFFARLLWGVRRELDGRAPLVVLMAGRAEEWRATTGYLRGGRAAGVLLVGARRDQVAPLVQAAAGAPVVLAGRPLDEVALPYVDVDNRGGAHAAVRHLLASGRRRIGTIAGPADMGAAVDRLAGYRLAAREAGICVNGLVCQGDFGRLSGERAMRRLLERRPDVDAVLAASDQMAVGALGALRRAGPPRPRRRRGRRVRRRPGRPAGPAPADDRPAAGGGPRRPAGARAARLHRRPPEHRARRRAAHQVDHPGVRLTAPG